MPKTLPDLPPGVPPPGVGEQNAFYCGDWPLTIVNGSCSGGLALGGGAIFICWSSVLSIKIGPAAVPIAAFLCAPSAFSSSSGAASTPWRLELPSAAATAVCWSPWLAYASS